MKKKTLLKDKFKGSFEIEPRGPNKTINIQMHLKWV